MNYELLSFVLLALIAIATAVGMLLSQNTVYSALHLIVNFASVAMLYLMLGAPFIALAQVTVYAGAIMVLFLFVIMLLGAEHLIEPNELKWQRPAAVVLGVLLLAEAIILIVFSEHFLPPAPTLVGEFTNPVNLAEELFNSYLLPFEIVSVLLLVAMIGAIVLTRRQTRAFRLRKMVQAETEMPQEKEA